MAIIDFLLFLSKRLDICNVKLSPEQQQILSQECGPGHVIEIRGFAGTGKTTTLIEYAWRRPHLRFLYIISAKPVPGETNRIFPPNVECTTMHALAYQCIGYKVQSFITSSLQTLQSTFMTASATFLGKS
ncbi:F-box DNA helicase 1-like [Rhincodon typus]|uniref:F-box DNA helicase 1-like n=1 Tax=Rhincodon typus TaxID=259920 RepID=UPI00202DF408|nr:F-box DNA helicase 1-like [Rhincodon typus]